MPTISIPNLIPRADSSNYKENNQRREMTASVNFQAAGDYTFDFTIPESNGTWDIPRTMFVDNSTNPNVILVTVSITNQTFPVPAYSAGYFPLSATPQSTIQVVSSGGASTFTTIEFFNYSVAPFVYGFTAATPSGTVSVQNPTYTALTNRDALLGAAVGADVFPAVATPRQVRFRNVGNMYGDAVAADNAFYVVNGNASADALSGNRMLPPNGIWEVLPYRTGARVNFFSTLGTYIEAEEWV